MQTVIASGSKSEHSAVVIVSDEGGGNPFVDPELEKLVCKQIQCEGKVHGQYFIVDGWSEVEG
jgi:hypothetical protein